MELFDMLANLFNSEEYKKNPVSQNLTDGQLAAINIGAINAEQTGYFCDSMKTGADISEIKENLENYYGITDSFSAVDTLDWLLEKGHRVYFDIIKGLASGKATGIDGSVPESREKERINEYISNLEDTLDELVEENFLSQKSALANCSIAAWDMGRMVTVARCCCDAG